jgi:SNF2 family DNA or RNA helicase
MGTPSAKKSHPPKFKRSAKSVVPYIGKTDPYIQQDDAFNFTANLAYCALFMQQGTGKTKVAIDRSVYNFERQKIQGVLVICPKSLMETWVEEIATHCPERVKPIVAVWNPRLQKRVIRELEAVIYNDDATRMPILIMNIEGIRTPKAMKLAMYWARHKSLHIICDESSKIKTPSAKQTLAAAKLAHACVARTILTGTPVSNSAADYYSQLAFLTPAPLGFSNYYSFRARYCVLENKTVRATKPYRKKDGTWAKTRKIIQITGPQNAEELKKRLLAFCYFVKKDECLDLPPKIYHKRYCDLTKEGIRLYKDVAKRILIDIEQTRELTIEYTLARLLRLQQVAGGFLPDDEADEATPIPGSNPKIDLLLETLEQFPGPTIIWARFKPEHDAIRRMLRAIVPDDQIGEITGRIKKDDREIARRAFQSGNIKYLVCTQSCAGYGYTLTAAESEIYFSNSFSLEHREQSEDRAHRIGLTHTVNYIDLLMRPPPGFNAPGVDDKTYTALMSKRDLAAYMTDVDDLRGMLS